MKEITRSEFEVDCDLVLLALGSRLRGRHHRGAARLRADRPGGPEVGFRLPHDGPEDVRVRRRAARGVAGGVGDLGGRVAARGVDAYLWTKRRFRQARSRRLRSLGGCSFGVLHRTAGGRAAGHPALDARASARLPTRVPYALLCTVVGLLLAQVPRFFHGPIPYKFDIHALDGRVAVWGWYVARMFIGFLVGTTRWPSWWWVRGPLCGLVMMVPLGFVSLAMAECGPACMFWNCFTGAAIGLLVGACAFLVTGRHRGP